jgi:MoaA/NifB/PqqE/SkfB family radical SAM enzyme
MYHRDREDSGDRFEFISKLSQYPERIDAVLRRDPVAAISVVYLDVNTELCNHHCVFCDGFYRQLHTASLPWSRLEPLAAEMKELGVLSVVIAGDRGEPMLHPRIGDLLRLLADCGIAVGMYTNGTVLPDAAVPALRAATWIRVSADAGSGRTHRLMHVYRQGRDDFHRLTNNVKRLAGGVRELGISFVLDPLNIEEITTAADLFLTLGASYVEYKPKYLPGYTVDSQFLAAHGAEISARLDEARARWGKQVVVNNQVKGLLLGTGDHSLRTQPRRCLTSLLRLVISTHGCYTCTPYRGEEERKCGDILTSSLREVLISVERSALRDRHCSRICAYHEQNQWLLGREGRKARATRAQSRHDSQEPFV